jgi:hypothetical protein
MPPWNLAKFESAEKKREPLIHEGVRGNPKLADLTRDAIQGYVCNVPNLSLLAGADDLYDEAWYQNYSSSIGSTGTIVSA